MKKLLKAFIIAIALILIFPSVAFAALGAPATLAIYSIDAYQSVLVTNDQLHIISYESSNVTGHSLNADSVYLFRFSDNGTEIATATPYAFYNSGFCQGVVAFYFAATDADIPAWGGSANLTIKLVGNPALDWGGDPPSTISSTWDTWNTNKILVGAKVRTQAIALEGIWNIDLIERIEGVNKLTSYGEDYFETVIPNIRLISPELFTSATTAPDFPSENHTTAYGDTVEDRWLAGWENPTGAAGDASWANQANAYDDDTTTFATGTIPGDSWSTYLTLTQPAVTVRNTRYWFTRQTTDITMFDLDVFYDAAWNPVVNDSTPTIGAWLERGLDAEHAVTSARIRFYNDNAAAREVYVHEFELGGDSTFDMTELADMFGISRNWAISVLYTGLCVGLLFVSSITMSKIKGGGGGVAAMGGATLRPALFLFGALMIIGSFQGFMVFEVGLFCGIAGGIALIFAIFWRGSV